MRVGSVEVELGGGRVRVDGCPVDLTPRERAVLDALAQRPGAVVTKQQLLSSVWNGAADGHAVEVTVGRLRRRLGGLVDILTVPRRGYRLTAPSRSDRSTA